ncbi:expressed conserved protein [Echinococcus multilocularis]|uniref:Expressed conserved protein n=1 Tax=Echinococcus multilocularis TaxID=6211 RepID=A0A068Y8X0_ECHMU|nr:expressed conserved protein [Echinococcus multilocularis]
MAACKDRAFLPPDCVCVSKRLHRAVSNWSLSDLDKIIWALERDNMLSVEELRNIVPSKKAEDLISLCLSNDAADFGGSLAPEQIPTEESTLEIMKNSFKSVVPAQFSPGPGISSVLRDIARNECSNDTENRCTAIRLGGPKGFISPDYGRIYGYIADSLTLVKARPRIEDSDVVVLLDMLFCLLHATDYLLTKGSSGDIERAFSGVTDKIGVLISSISASYHHRCAFLKKISVSSTYDIESLTSSFPQGALASASCRPNVLPYTAPILVLKEAWLSSNFSQCILLKKAMRDIFRECWQLPAAEGDENLEKVQKKLTKFIMNPLCIKVKDVPSVCEYLSTLGMLMRHYEERIASRIVPSTLLTTPEPRTAQNTLIHSAAKLIADYQSGKRNLVRPVSLPVERCEVDRFINTVHIPRPDVPRMAMKTTLSPQILRSIDSRRRTDVPRVPTNSFKAKKAPSRPPKLYRRVD